MGFNMGVHHATNIYMEALALFNGLEIAIQKELLPLRIETDCKELINMLSNKSCSYQNLLDDCRYLLAKAERVSIKHVYREANGNLQNSIARMNPERRKTLAGTWSNFQRSKSMIKVNPNLVNGQRL
ncbi:hypothetical protein RND71_003310 [Anisodus tanguticus]|uniref:RNase H type-1 domain-containing protein n=1 Tax=Anisodus tanguticus TaxID=243964 RepID=A0AAE1SW77_9SOLA|nr:hypothetical protein RND71_003310 [Anisodus tanguticus]